IIFQMLGYLHRISSGYFKRCISLNYGTNNVDIDFKDYSRVELLLNELDNIDLENNKVIVWYRYHSDYDMICEKIKYDYCVLHGRMSQKKKDLNINRFKKNINILIANVASGSYGLNL